MKKWKSILSAALAGIMILSTVVSVGAANVSFTDISNHWAKPQINYLVSKDVLNGYQQSNGTYIFKPEGEVTRAEFIKMLDETFGLTATAGINYSDVKTTDWFHTYFSKAAAQGYLLNYGTSVSPNGKLTREEATTLLVRYLGLLNAPKADASKFTDYNKISSNFRDPVMVAVNAGLINGYQESNGTYTFRPQNTLTRAEALTILYRAAGAIYNTSAYSKDSGSPDTNAVITKGGVTLGNLNLSGRVIVTEGVTGDSVTLTGCTVSGSFDVRGASTLILDGCTIESLTVDSVAPEIKVSLSGNTRINSLTLNSKITMTASSGSRISSMTVNAGARNVNVTGDGTIEKITINESGFVSTMMPAEFHIASGLTANFASQPYSGTSDDQASFSMMPYMTEVSNQYYLNVTPDDTGRVYYFFTNQRYAPTIGEFESAYASSTYKNSFYAQANKTYSEATFSSSTISRYDYVVVQLVSDDRTYSPILIDNAPTTGTGFSVEPYFDGDEIEYTPDVSGTVMYYYSTSGDELTAAQFETSYKRADSAMRGTKSVTANRGETIALKDSYLTNYPFVIVVLQNTNGQFYKPVVVSAGNNGFREEPVITTLGKIEFETEVSGTLYYYYAEDDDMPTPKEFADLYPTQRGRKKIDVTKNREGSITYDQDITYMYPYMVFCIQDNNDNYLTPFVLKIDVDTGFSVDPYVSAPDEISFKAAQGGTVYWYFTKYDTVPSMDDFMDEYYDTASARRGYEIIRYTSGISSFNFDTSYVEQYPYIAIMLMDAEEENHQPVIVDVKNSTSTGFIVDPYCDLVNEAVYFRAAGKGTVYYYFSRTSTAYNETPEDFWSSYAYAGSSFSGSYPVSTTLDYIPFASIDTNKYPGIMIIFVDEYENESYPVYVSLTRDGSSGTSTTGVTVLTITASTVTLSVDVNGTIYYKESNSSTASLAGGSSKSVYKNSTVTLYHSGKYPYMIVQLEGYEPFTIDISEDYDRNEDLEDGSNKNGNGFSVVSWDLVGEVTMTGIADVTGTVTMSISNTADSATASVSVTKGETFTISIPFDIDKYMNSTLGQLLGSGTIYVQLTASNGDVYERMAVNF